MTGSSGYCLLASAALLAACANQDYGNDHPGVRWVQTAAEFDALSLQAYQSAAGQLDDKIADTSWSALPYQTDASDLPPAIIFDVDETVVSNVEFQATLEPPFEEIKLFRWTRANPADPIAGFAEFAALAHDRGVELFFVTNRGCARVAGYVGPCPYEAVTSEDIGEAGFVTDVEHVLLAYEQPHWSKEKKVRRDYLARNYRIIMLFGDDLGDFIPCSRRRALDPCNEGATIASRRRATMEHRDYWGNGWYVLPNPMHGSWTTVR